MAEEETEAESLRVQARKENIISMLIIMGPGSGKAPPVGLTVAMAGLFRAMTMAMPTEARKGRKWRIRRGSCREPGAMTLRA
jgi:hypothetical protein